MGTMLAGVGAGLFFVGGLMGSLDLIDGRGREALPGIVMFALGVIMMGAVVYFKLPVRM